MRKIAAILATGAMALTLVGAGLGASFTDSATATVGISVGTFAVNIVAPSDGTIAGDAKSVSFTCAQINSSAAGSCPFTFTVKDVGSIDASTVHVTAVISGDGAQFSAIGAGADFALAAGATHLVSGGIQWTELGAANLGQTVTVTYTITANA